MHAQAFDQAIGDLIQRVAHNDPGVIDEVARLARHYPQRVEPWLVLARFQRQRGNPAASLQALLRAQSLQPTNAAVALDIGVLQFGSGRRKEAALTLEAALRVNPTNVPLLFHRAYLHELDGDDVSAERRYRSALASDPLNVQSLANLGALLNRSERHQEARELLEPALQQRPQAMVAYALVVALIASTAAPDALGAALVYTEMAADAEPTSAEAWLAAAMAARKLRDLDRAERHLRRAAAAIDPQQIERVVLVESELAAVMAEAGDYPASRQHFRGALHREPQNLALRWQAAMSLPSPAMSSDEAAEAHESFDADLSELEQIMDGAGRHQLHAGFDAASRHLPFPLAYLPFETTSLMQRYGALLQQLVAARAPQLVAPVPWRALEHNGRTRIGFISANLRTHTLMRYFRNWLDGLDRQRHCSYLWHVGQVADAETAEIAAAADHFRVHQGDPLLVAESIREARLDVLVFLDIGMDARLSVIASLRCAPVQCAAYGHPLTTGLPSIDVFLSGSELERDDAPSRYTERLLCLPGLGVRPAVPPPPNLGFAAPRRSARPQLLCTQMPFKLQPEFDRLAARVIAATDAELFVFSVYETAAALQDRVLARLSAALREQALDPARHLRLLPNCGHADYLGIVSNADLVLDTPWFTGGATSMDAFHVGTPVATIDGVALRARQTAAMARMIGSTDLVGSDLDDCAARAIDVLSEPGRRRELGEQIRQAAPQLFNDARPLAALNELLQLLAEEARERGPA